MSMLLGLRRRLEAPAVDAFASLVVATKAGKETTPERVTAVVRAENESVLASASRWDEALTAVFFLQV
jgi:hypothetical protein